MEGADNFAIQNLTKGKLPRLPFVDIKEAVIGAEYELSLVFVGKQRSTTLNKKYRNKETPANVLSFPLEENVGEIIITPEVAKRQAKDFDMTYPHFIGKLLIHGLLHLKGHSHGATMDRLEQTHLRHFKLL